MERINKTEDPINYINIEDGEIDESYAIFLSHIMNSEMTKANDDNNAQGDKITTRGNCINNTHKHNIDYLYNITINC